MAATTFEVHVAIDDDKLLDGNHVFVEKQNITASFTASLNHWIAERQLELRGRVS